VQPDQQDVFLQVVEVVGPIATQSLVEMLELAAAVRDPPAQQRQVLVLQTLVAVVAVQVSAAAVHLQVVLVDLVLLSFVISMHL
jgi:hypothetical protein